MKVIVTGAAGVLGRAVVARFADDGHTIACIDRIKGPAREGCHWIVAEDLADSDVAEDRIALAVRQLGGIDALVHLVGGFDWKPVAQTTRDDWRSLYTTNLETAVSTIQAVLPWLARGAAIVTVGAASAQPAGAGMAAYAAAKSGVARLSEALAQELKPGGVRVNTILPAIIDTPRNRADMPDADFGTWTSPEAIADAIAFLASPASRAVNGASLEVTNGTQ